VNKPVNLYYFYSCIHIFFYFSIFSIFLLFLLFLGLGPAQPTWAGLGPARLATGPNQWPGKINCTARVKQFHACSNCAKVIKLPSHSSSFAQLKQEWRENENGLPASGGREEACRTAISFSSVYACSFCFPFFRWWWRSRLAARVLPFSDLLGELRRQWC
jgi:hypothetical protein